MRSAHVQVDIPSAHSTRGFLAALQAYTRSHNKCSALHRCVTLFSFQFLGEFKALTESRMRTTTPRCATATSAAEGAAGVSSAGDSGGVVAEPETTIAAQLAGSYSDRALVLCSVVHNADLANCAKTWNLAKAWTYRLMDEFCEVLTAATHCQPVPLSLMPPPLLLPPQLPLPLTANQSHCLVASYRCCCHDSYRCHLLPPTATAMPQMLPLPPPH